MNAKRAAAATRHGLSYHPTYRVWLGIRARCTNPKHPAWPHYGGRGIGLCERWLDPAAFVADMGTRPTLRHEIDRIDNDRGYEPGNCRWATRSENDRNRRSNVWIEFRGERRVLAELCEAFGVPDDTARWRLKVGWTPERAFTTPVRPKAPNGSAARARGAA